mgnify:CR=1 FL=1
MNQSLKIDPYGFREYDARWVYNKDINAEGITNLGKGFGTQIINHTKKNNTRVIVGHDYRSYSEDIKDNLFLNVSKELLDNEKFISDCLDSGMNNYGHPLQYASKRIQKLYE